MKEIGSGTESENLCGCESVLNLARFDENGMDLREVSDSSTFVDLRKE